MLTFAKRSLVFGLGFLIVGFVTSGSAIANERDPFARRIFFSHGDKYADQQLDLSESRNLIHLTDAAVVAYGFASSAQTIDRSAVYVANFKHQGKYWIAKIPKHGVQRSIFQFQNLSSLAKKGIPKPVLTWMRVGHVQMRFQMKHGSEIELRTQNIGATREKVFVNDFSYALLATRAISKRGQGFHPLTDGLERGYGTSHNFLSTEESALRFKEAGLNVEQFPMQITEEQSNKILAFYIQTSVSTFENEIYHTLEHSCVTVTMNGIYESVPNTHVLWIGRFWRNWRWLRPVSATFESNPRAVVALLEKQDYIDASKQIPNLEAEPRKTIAPCCEAVFH